MSLRGPQGRGNLNLRHPSLFLLSGLDVPCSIRSPDRNPRHKLHWYLRHKFTLSLRPKLWRMPQRSGELCLLWK